MSKPDPERLNVVKCAREISCMTQADFALELSEKTGKNITQQRVNEWENGRISPRKIVREVCARDAAIYGLMEIEKVIGVSLDNLIDEKEFDKKHDLILDIMIQCQS